MKGETDEIKRLREEKRRLKEAPADATPVRNALESPVEVANEHCRTDLKKTSAVGDRSLPGKERREREQPV
jgi:hypothetical protein